MTNHFRDLYISTGAIGYTVENLSFIRRIGTPGGKLSLNETPASRQLQINHVNLSNDIDNSLHESFLASLNSLGYPQGDGSLNYTFKMIAASNGSECAKQQDVGSGGSLMKYDGTITTTFLTSMIAHTGLMIAGGLTAGYTNLALAYPPLMIFGTVPGTDQF